MKLYISIVSGILSLSLLGFYFFNAGVKAGLSSESIVDEVAVYNSGSVGIKNITSLPSKIQQIPQERKTIHTLSIDTGSADPIKAELVLSEK